MKVTKYSALLALLMTSGLVHAQTNVDQEITAPTWNAANSTDTYAETVASLNATGLTPAEIAANAVNDAFAAAVTTLNEDEATPGSAAFYRAARIALDADPTNVVRQAELARAQTLYSTNLTTVTNLEAAAEVEGVSINTFSGASGQDVIGIDLDDSEGAAAVALAAAQEASNAIEGILDYYGEGAGATTTEESFADLEGEVIDPLRDLVASDPALDVNNDGFLDADALAVTTAAGNLATAEADYQTVASDPTSTQAEIATAAGALAGAQTAFATSVVTLYDNFSPITAPTKDALLGSVLNGSWERDAIQSSAEGLAQEVADRAAGDETLTENLDAEVDARIAADETLTENLDAEVDARTALIRTEGDNADGNPIIHIGENSLVTQELGGEQLLSATDGVNDIDIRISGDTNLIVDNDLTVTGATTTNGITNTGGIGTGSVTATGNVGSATSSTSGNATVGGTLNVSGASTTNGINNSGQKITGLANGTSAADAATFGQMQTADNALGLRIDDEITARILGDTTESNARIAADNLIRSDFAAADTTERNARIAGDNLIRSDFAAADTTERNARIAGDSRLQSNIDENTRGIAMVAAMTNTTVDTGKTHGVDFNMAQFQSETGFAFGYANRINENVQVHTSVASTTDFDESVVRLGVAVQW